MATAKTAAKPIPEGGIQPGHEVRDIVTGFTGIITSKTEYINGCIRCGVLKNKLNKDGDVTQELVFDIQQLEYIGLGVRAKIKQNTEVMSKAEATTETPQRTGGPRPLGSAAPRSIPKR